MTFEELLDIVAGDRAGLHLDLKETGYEGEVVRAVLDRISVERLVITSADASIHTIKEQFPGIRVGAFDRGGDRRHASRGRSSRCG